MNESMAGAASTAVQTAWRNYHAKLEEIRERLLSHPFSVNDRNRGAAWYYLQMVQQTAFDMYIAPVTAYPHLQIIYSPFEVTTTQACPDFLHRKTVLDGSRTYRLWGRAGTTCWADIQVQAGYWGDVQKRHMGNYQFSAFAHDDEGRFEIVISATPHPGNWIEMDPSSRHMVLLIREAFGDWDHEQPIEMHIEAVDRDQSDTIAPSEMQMAERLDCAARFIDHATNFCLGISDGILKGTGGPNLLLPLDASTRTQEGGNPLSYFYFLLHKVGPDQALVVELDFDALYWGASLADVWMRTADYSYRQTSLNHHQAKADSDGIVRLVLSHRDPGFWNWIDLEDAEQGIVVIRIYGYRRVPSANTRVVELSDLAAALPDHSWRADKEERNAALSQRRRASLRRFGY